MFYFLFDLQQGRRSTESFLKYYVVKHSPPLKKGKLESVTEETEIEVRTNVPVTTQVNGGVNGVTLEMNTKGDTVVKADINVTRVTEIKSETIENSDEIRKSAELMENGIHDSEDDSSDKDSPMQKLLDIGQDT